MSSIKYLGHSSFEINLEGRIIYTDPWFNPKPKEVQRLAPPLISAVDVKKADFILISHEHFDHCDPFDVAGIEKRTFATVLAPEETLVKLDIPENKKVSVSEGETFNLQGVDFTITQAKHPQSVHPVGFIVEYNGKSFYFAGDTYDFYDMNLIDVDVSMIPIGGTYTMDVLAAVNSLKRIKTSFVIPMHYNTFPAIKANVEEFAKRVKQDTKCIPVVLKIGGEFNF